MSRSLKPTFLSGLAVLLPLLITFWILRFMVLFLGQPFVHLVENALRSHGFFQEGFWIFAPNQLILLTSYFILFLGMILITMLMGLLLRVYYVNHVVKSVHWIFDKTPFVNKIFQATKEVVETVLKDNKKNFGKAVLVPFPMPDMFCIGFITQDEMSKDELKPISVLLPNTPLPTIGFLVYYRRDQLRPLNFTVEEAFKAVISGGLLIPR